MKKSLSEERLLQEFRLEKSLDAVEKVISMAEKEGFDVERLKDSLRKAREKKNRVREN